MRTQDAIGRSTFHHKEHRSGIRPTPREIRWLSFIHRHGPQSSLYLHELTRGIHRDRDTSLRQMQKLRAGNFSAARKSYRSSIRDYATLIGDGLYKDHYGLTAGMLLLYIFSSKSNEQRFLETTRTVVEAQQRITGEFSKAAIGFGHV